MKRKHLRGVIFLLVLLACCSVVVAACGGPGTAASGSSTPTSNCASGTAHTLASSFKESCVDVAKGAQLQIIPSVTSFHNLDTGSWVNGNPVPMNEPGAPPIHNVQVTTSTVSIGPWNTTGTFHIYCTVHPGMNLTVIVT
jgi:plastocyanin